MAPAPLPGPDLYGLLVPEGLDHAGPGGVGAVDVSAVDLLHAVEVGIAVGRGVGPLQKGQGA
jgi:hypothetical protein